MKRSVELHGCSVQVRLSGAAERALGARSAPLMVEAELYFSCLIRKRVCFFDGDHADAVEVAPGLQLRFRPIMTAACSVGFEGDEPPVTDFPIQRGEAFVPKLVTIDFRAGAWCGAFGYA